MCVATQIKLCYVDKYYACSHTDQVVLSREVVCVDTQINLCCSR